MVAEIERVPLCDVWRYEDHDFTPWLEKNIDALSEELGFELYFEGREVKTLESGYRADLVASGEEGEIFVIENQLKKIDHDHIGKLITYLPAIKADSAIWIVAEASPEHIRAVYELNKSCKYDFYLLQIEAIRVNNSDPAPLFRLISGPSKTMTEMGKDRQKINEEHRKRREWWEGLVQHPAAKKRTRSMIPSKHQWISFGSGIHGLDFWYGVDKGDSEVFFQIDRNKVGEAEGFKVFDQLRAKRDKIENDFDDTLKWERNEKSRYSWITKNGLSGGFGYSEDTWKESQREIISAMNRLVKAIRPRLKKMGL